VFQSRTGAIEKTGIYSPLPFRLSHHLPRPQFVGCLYSGRSLHDIFVFFDESPMQYFHEDATIQEAWATEPGGWKVPRRRGPLRAGVVGGGQWPHERRSNAVSETKLTFQSKVHRQKNKSWNLRMERGQEKRRHHK